MVEDSERLRKFMKNVVKVTKRKHEHQKAKENLGKQIEKIKTLAVKKGVKKASISRALKELEKKVEEVIEKEKLSISRTEGISTELKSMEDKFSSFTTKDIQLITALRDRIENLEGERAKQIDDAVEELKLKFIDVEKAKSSRDERILELEQKIKQKVSDNFIELMKIEDQLKQMEIKYKLLKKEGKVDKKTLRAFKGKTEALKEHLFIKKKKLIEDEMEKGAPLPELPPMPKPTKKIKRTGPVIKHDVIMKPALPEGSMPEPPQFPKESIGHILHEEHIPVIKLRRERPKKRGFFKKLFHLK